MCTFCCWCRVIGHLLGQLLARSPETSALVRTTAAVTLLSGGTAQNVLPQSGNITINFRHLPGAGCGGVVVLPL